MRFSLNIVILVVLITLLSCQEEQTIEELIEIELQNKIEKFKKEKISNCWKYINTTAVTYVDSIMYLEIGTSMNNSIILPERPVRPEDSIGYKIELDSSSPKDMWIDSSYVE